MSKPEKKPGFIIEMRDGSRYFIPPDKWTEWYVEGALANKKDLDAGRDRGQPRLTRKIAKEWADKHLSGEWVMDDYCIEGFFGGTEWSDFEDIAVRLPDNPRLAPDELWDEDSKIEFVPAINPFPERSLPEDQTPRP